MHDDPDPADTPPHPRSPARWAERVLGGVNDPARVPSTAALLRAEAGMRTPLESLVRGSGTRPPVLSARVHVMATLLPAAALGAGAAALGATAAGAIGGAVAVGIATYVATRHTTLRRDADATAVQVARAFDGLYASRQDLPSPAHDALARIDAHLAELLPRPLASTDARAVLAAVTRHLPEALALYRALPPSARPYGDAQLLAQLGAIEANVAAVLQATAAERLRDSRQLSRFLRDRAAR